MIGWTFGRGSGRGRGRGPRSGGRGRGFNNKSNLITPMTGSFKGVIEKMNRYIFASTTTPNDIRTEFNRTLERLKVHTSQNCESLELMTSFRM